MRQRLRTAVLLLLLSVWFFPPIRVFAASPWEAWRSGYTNCEKAERQAERGNYTEALTLFEKAKKSYLDVRASRPDWNQRVIAERIAECDRRIKEVRRLLGGVNRRTAAAARRPGKTPPSAATGHSGKTPPRSQQTTSTAAPSAGTAPAASTAAASSDETVDIGEYLELRAECVRVKEQLAALTKKLVEQRAALLESRREVESLRKNSQTQRRFEAEIANLVRDRRIAVEKYNLLMERCRQLEADLAKPDARIEVLNSNLVEARLLLEKERKRAEDALRRLNEAETLARNNQLARSAAEKLMTRARADHSNALREIEALRSQISDLEARIKELTVLITDLRKQNTELLAHSQSSQESSERSSQAANAEIVRLRAELASRDRQIAELENRNRQLTAALETSRRQQQDAQNHLTAMQEEFRTGSEALKKSMADAAALRLRNSELEADIKQLSLRVETLAKRLETRDSEDFRNASAARETCRKLEKDLLTLQNELVVIRNASNSANIRIADLQRQLKSANSELKTIRNREAALIAEREQLNAEVTRLRDVEKKLVVIQHNFDALSKENKENRALLAAAKPKERELAHVKLRLLELDRLKASLVKEQQLNEELRNETRRLAAEVKTLRARSTELDKLRRRLTEFAGVKKELEALRSLRTEYQRIANVEKLFAALKIRAAELETLLREQQTQINTLKRDNSTLAGDLAAAGKQLAALESLQRRNRELDEMIISQNQEIARLNGMIAKLNAGDPDVMPREYRRQIDGLRATIAKLSPIADQLARLQQEYASAKQQFTARVTRLTSRCQAAEELTRLRDEEIKRLQKLNAELAAMNRSAEDSLKNRVDQAQLTRVNSELSAMRQLYATITAERDRLIAELDNLRRGIQVDGADHGITESPEELAATGLRAERNGNFELAIWNYRQALTVSPDFGSVHLRLGYLLFARKDYTGALPHLSSARVNAPDNLDLALKTARCQIELKRFGNAKSIVDTLIKKKPDDYRVQILAGLISAASGSSTAAEERLVTACRLAPENPEAFIELARLLCDTPADRKDEAVKAYEMARALGAAPVPELETKLSSRLNSRRDMIRFFASAASEAEIGGDFGSAVWYYRKLVEIKPEDFVPRLALALHRSSHTAQAREALEFNTPSRLGMMVLAIIENDSGNHSAALRAARQCNGIKLPADWQALTMEISKLQKGNHLSAAMRMLLSGIQK